MREAWSVSCIVETPTQTLGTASIDLENIENVFESHLGPEYTVVILKGGERVTVKEELVHVRRRLVHQDKEPQIGEVVKR